MEFWSPLFLSLKLGLAVTACLFLIGIPLAGWLSWSRSSLRPFAEALVSLPLVLPPAVLGFYLLLAFSPENFFGKWMEQWFGIRLLFSFPGLVIGGIIFSVPYFLNPLLGALKALPQNLREASLTLGKSEWTTYIRVLLPNAKQGLITGAAMAFTHTLGEFGVVLMLGGNIPGLTRLASVALYDKVEAMQYAEAHTYAIILLLFSTLVLSLLAYLNPHSRRSNA